MPSTTVHIPDKLLSKMDRIVKKKGISRNRFIVQACEQELNNDAGQWPKDFFDPGLSKEQLKLPYRCIKNMPKIYYIKTFL